MSISDLDALLDGAIGQALRETTGASPEYVARQTGVPAWAVQRTGGGQAPPPLKAGTPRWTPEDDEFLRENLGRISEDEVAARLGRTRAAVRLRWKRDLGLPAPTRTPGRVTANQAARMLGVDVHAVVNWIDDGLLPARILPLRMPRRVRSIKVSDLRRFVARPGNWIYFDPHGVRDPGLGRLVRLAHERWGDEWLTTGAVARMHSLTNPGAISRRAREGTLPAQRRGGGGNWLVRRSDAEGLVIFPHGCHERYSPAGDFFLVLARAVGLTFATIGRLMGRREQTVFFRLGRLEVAEVLGGVEGVSMRPLAADWRRYGWRFPYLARAMEGLAAGKRPAAGDVYDLRGVLRSWAIFCLGPDHDIVRRLRCPACRPRPGFWPDIYQELRREIDALSSSGKSGGGDDSDCVVAVDRPLAELASPPGADPGLRLRNALSLVGVRYLAGAGGGLGDSGRAGYYRGGGGGGGEGGLPIRRRGAALAAGGEGGAA